MEPIKPISDLFVFLDKPIQSSAVLPRVLIDRTRKESSISVERSLKNIKDMLDSATPETPEQADRLDSAYNDLELMLKAIK